MILRSLSQKINDGMKTVLGWYGWAGLINAVWNLNEIENIKKSMDNKINKDDMEAHNIQKR